MTNHQAPLCDLRNVNVFYRASGFRRKPFHAVKDVTLEVSPGRTLGVVGESGSGKSTLGRAILGLAHVASGTISFDGRDITNLPRKHRRALATELQVVFQDPYGSLNPTMQIGDILTEPLRQARVENRKRAAELLDLVGLPKNSVGRRPHEFSGGQRQRIAIARALAGNPRFIICDEPVSALDLLTQARILDLLLSIQEEMDISYLFISHDLDVIRHMSHDIAVMENGALVEKGSARQVGTAPSEPYTKRLLLASPVLDPDAQRERRAQFKSLQAQRIHA